MAYEVYSMDDAKTRESILGGEELEVFESEYGHNEHLFDWLWEEGIWGLLTSMRPEKGANGKRPESVSGAWVLVNLAHIGQLQKADPILRDGRLMKQAGFNLREGESAIHRDTLRNHLKRILPEESERVFYEQVALFRKRKWLRGKVYAADCFEIEASGGYENRGSVWDEDERCWRHGYKACVLFNVSAARPRIVGLSLGPINADERDLLREILGEIAKHVVTPRRMIDILLMDRGFWGASFLKELRSSYKFHLVIPAISSHSATEEVKELVAVEKQPPQEHRIQKRNNQGQEVRLLRRAVGVEGVDVLDQTKKAGLKMNAVYLKEINMDTGAVDDVIFFTTLPTKQKPMRVVEYYDQRWEIENRCIRTLSQRWGIRTLVGRRFCAIYAQLLMICMCYNATRVYEEKKPKEAEQLKEEMQERGRKSYLLGARIIVFVPRLRIYTTMSGMEYAELTKERALRQVAELVARGVSVEEAIRRAKEPGTT